MTFDFVYYRCSLIYFLSSELEYGKVILLILCIGINDLLLSECN